MGQSDHNKVYWVIEVVNIVSFTHSVRDVRMVAMLDLFAIIMTCTPPSSYTLHHLFSGTLEYCTVCSANSLVAGSGSGMV